MVGDWVDRLWGAIWAFMSYLAFILRENWIPAGLWAEMLIWIACVLIGLFSCCIENRLLSGQEWKKGNKLGRFIALTQSRSHGGSDQGSSSSDSEKQSDSGGKYTHTKYKTYMRTSLKHCWRTQKRTL